jgi:ketosteroid isomerase-like protein
MLRSILAAAALIALAGPALAQTNARAPDWARPILANDAEAMRINRPNLAAQEGGVAVRLTIAPAQGGVARLIRYDSSPAGAGLGVRAFTGHLRNGWMLWGGEDPLARPVTAAKKAELDRLARAALSASLISGEGSQSSASVCADGDYAWLEVADGARSVTFERRCATGGASGALIKAISDAAGGRDEEELFQSGVAEIIAADRAFSQASVSDGAPSAMVAFAADGGRLFVTGQPAAVGQTGIAAALATWEAGSVLQWTPAGADIAARGDMGFSWGSWTLTKPDAAPLSGSYLSVWRRDGLGKWRYLAHMSN